MATTPIDEAPAPATDDGTDNEVKPDGGGVAARANNLDMPPAGMA